MKKVQREAILRAINDTLDEGNIYYLNDRMIKTFIQNLKNRGYIIVPNKPILLNLINQETHENPKTRVIVL